MITNNQEDNSENGGSFQIIQPHRDLEVNWGIDIAKNLEDFLLKIYSGEVDNDGHSSINFAQAALLIQGSVQVYSRKVDYLYNLVLQTLESISQESQPEQPENVSELPEEGDVLAVSDNLDDFWVSDEIEVDPNCTLDYTRDEATLDEFVRSPIDFHFLEGGGLDATGDGGEIQSYQLATTYSYKDFLLLDSCDAVVVNDFVKGDNEVNKGQDGGNMDRSQPSKSYGEYDIPTKVSRGSVDKISVGKSQDTNLQKSPHDDDHGFGLNNHNETNDHEFPKYYGCPIGGMDDSENSEDDSWKLLNPHEPGNLEVKPFKKASRSSIVNLSKQVSRTTDFPVPSLDGPISSEFAEIWDARCRDREIQQGSQSPPLYEKLRQSLVLGGLGNVDAYLEFKDGDDDDGHNSEDNDFEPHILDIAERENMNEDIHVLSNTQEDGSAHGHESPIPEDLSRSNQDSLLANFRESDMKTKMDARVLSWKKKIERDLEEHESRPAFDIKDYGERVMDKLSKSVDNENAMSFADVVRGQGKHEVARSFSALLQLVNDGNVDLLRSTDRDSTCYTEESPFSIRLLRNAKRKQEFQPRSPKKKSLT